MSALINDDYLRGSFSGSARARRASSTVSSSTSASGHLSRASRSFVARSRSERFRSSTLSTFARISSCHPSISALKSAASCCRREFSACECDHEPERLTDPPTEEMRAQSHFKLFRAQLNHPHITRTNVAATQNEMSAARGGGGRLIAKR